MCSAWRGRREPATFEPALVVTSHDDREALLRALGVMDEARQRLDRLEAELLDAARVSGASWREIAAALGLSSPQAAFQRASRHRRRDRHRRGEASSADVA